MNISILQICLISLFYCFSNISWPFGSMGQWATINRPLVGGLVVGLILGNPVQGTIIGATINVIYLGLVSAGGSLPADSGMAGIMGTTFALIGGLDTNTALALAVPMGLVGAVIEVLTMTGQCMLIPLADKWIEQGKSKLVIWANTWIPYIVKSIIRFIIVFVILYFGSNALDSVTNALSGRVLDALSVMGGMLPAVGIMGTTFALIGGLDTNTALALAVPMGLVGAVIEVLTMTGQCMLIPLADKWIEQGKSKLVIWANTWIPYIVKSIIRFIIVFVILYFGSNALDSVTNALSGRVLDALSVMGGMLPAVGVGMMLLSIFKGNARWFLFLGFLATSFLGLNTIAVAFIFLIVAVLMVGFTESDFAGFKSIQQNNDLSYQYFTKKDLRHSWYLWHWFCESCYNYERMQGLGFCTAMIPLLRKIYKGDDEAMIAAMKRQSMFFNTDHDFGGMILGICASMEEQKRSGADIPDEAFVALKSGLMGPCAGIGDTLSQVVLLPVLSVIFINLATQGAVWAPIAYTVLFMAIFYGVGYWMLNVGYKSGGEAVLKLMESGIFDKVVKVANILGCAVCGALICSYVSFNWNVVMMREGVEVFNLQTGVFDAILPNMMPLLLTMGVYGLSKKGVKSSYITFGTMLLGFVLGLLGVIA